jgi:hypothetical protein
MMFRWTPDHTGRISLSHRISPAGENAIPICVRPSEFLHSQGQTRKNSALAACVRMSPESRPSGPLPEIKIVMKLRLEWAPAGI